MDVLIKNVASVVLKDTAAAVEGFDYKCNVQIPSELRKIFPFLNFLMDWQCRAVNVRPAVFLNGKNGQLGCYTN